MIDWNTQEKRHTRTGPHGSGPGALNTVAALAVVEAGVVEELAKVMGPGRRIQVAEDDPRAGPLSHKLRDRLHLIVPEPIAAFAHRRQTVGAEHRRFSS